MGKGERKKEMGEEIRGDMTILQIAMVCCGFLPRKGQQG